MHVKFSQLVYENASRSCENLDRLLEIEKREESSEKWNSDSKWIATQISTCTINPINISEGKINDLKLNSVSLNLKWVECIFSEEWFCIWGCSSSGNYLVVRFWSGGAHGPSYLGPTKPDFIKFGPSGPRRKTFGREKISGLSRSEKEKIWNFVAHIYETKPLKMY